MDRKSLDSFIMSEFGGISRDNPWESSPEYTVYRHVDNRKWFALLYCAKARQLKALKPDDPILRDYDDNEMIDILGLKVEDGMVPDVSRSPGTLPAWHMNRRYWINIVLDGSVPLEVAAPLIDLSFRLTAKRKTL